MTLDEIKRFELESEKPVVYEETVINEVEKIQLVFSKFFRTSTDFSQLIIPSKQNNIYNMEEINKQARKDLIIANILSSKVVMMIEEEGERNFMNMHYQQMSLQRSRVRRRISQ